MTDSTNSNTAEGEYVGVVLNDIGTTETFPIPMLNANVPIREVAGAAAPPIVLAGTAATLVSFGAPNLTLPAGVLGVLISAALYITAPSDATIIEWMRAIGTRVTQQDDPRHVRENRGHERDLRDEYGGTAFEITDTTQDHTRIERFYENQDAAERRDGTMLAAIEVDPANMAVATQSEQRSMTEQWASFLNSSVDWPLQLYSPTAEFPVDDHIQTLRDRRDDPDVQNDRPVMWELIQGRLEWAPEYYAQRGTNARQYYIIVHVSEADVNISTAGDDDGSVVDAVLDAPGINAIADVVGLTDEEEDAREEARRRAAQFDKLDARCTTIRNGLNSLDGVSGRRLNSAEFAALIKEYWTGDDELLTGENDLEMRTLPFVQYDDGAGDSASAMSDGLETRVTAAQDAAAAPGGAAPTGDADSTTTSNDDADGADTGADSGDADDTGDAAPSLDEIDDADDADE